MKAAPTQQDTRALEQEEKRQRQLIENQAAIKLMQEWLANDDPEDQKEQRETWEHLRCARISSAPD